MARQHICRAPFFNGHEKTFSDHISEKFRIIELGEFSSVGLVGWITHALKVNGGVILLGYLLG